jgi:ATP synthase protein I
VAAQSNHDAASSGRKSTATGAQLGKPPILRIVIAQLIALSLVSSTLLLWDTTTALSVFFGGLIAIVPNAYFAKWAFRYAGAKSAANVARSFYRGEAGKFVLTTVLFAAVFMYIRPLNAIALFLSYIVLMALNWMLALRSFNRY